jgi:hypothetical protein
MSFLIRSVHLSSCVNSKVVVRFADSVRGSETQRPSNPLRLSLVAVFVVEGLPAILDMVAVVLFACDADLDAVVAGEFNTRMALQPANPNTPTIKIPSIAKTV